MYWSNKLSLLSYLCKLLIVSLGLTWILISLKKKKVSNEVKSLLLFSNSVAEDYGWWDVLSYYCKILDINPSRCLKKNTPVFNLRVPFQSRERLCKLFAFKYKINNMLHPNLLSNPHSNLVYNFKCNISDETNCA